MGLTQWNSICICTVLEYNLACIFAYESVDKEGFSLIFLSRFLTGREGVPSASPLSIALTQSVGASASSVTERKQNPVQDSHTALKKACFLLDQVSIFRNTYPVITYRYKSCTIKEG